MPTEEELKKGFTIGEWEVLPARGELRRGGDVEKPEPKVFGVLLALAGRNGDLVTKDELVDEVWDGRATADEPIIRCVALLRKHLGDKDRPYQYIETLARRGYRLVQEVSLHQAAEPVPDPGHAAAKPKGRLVTWAALAIAGIIAVTVYMRPPEVPVPVGSIAVLPFENLSGDPELQYLVSGFKHELVKTLSNIPDVSVKDVQDPYTGMEVTVIASRLGVESVLKGGVQREGERLKVNYHLARGSNGMTISTDSILVSTNEVFDGQEQLAGLVRDGLQGESEQVLVASSRPEDQQGHIRYMQGLYAFQQRGQPGKLEEAMALFEETITLDPGFGPAYLELAMAYALLPDARGAPLAQAHARALEIVETGIGADASISDAADAVVGFVHHKRKNWSLAEQAYRRATSAPIVDSNAYNWYSLLLSNVGRLDDALLQALEAQRLDPRNGVINSRVAIAYAWLDQRDAAAEYFERAKQLGGVTATLLLANALVQHRAGDFAAAQQSLSEAVALAGSDTAWIEQGYLGLRDTARREASIAALDAAAAAKIINPQIELTMRTMLGDTDGAMQIARQLARRDGTYEMDLLFLPELLPLRLRPDFIELVDRLGVTEYWDEAGCVWLGTAIECPESL